MELFGLKDKDGNEYKAIVDVEPRYGNMSDKNVTVIDYVIGGIVNIEPVWPGPIESPPKSKELPKTIEELKNLLCNWRYVYTDVSLNVDRFLKKQGYDIPSHDEDMNAFMG